MPDTVNWADFTWGPIDSNVPKQGKRNYMTRLLCKATTNPSAQATRLPRTFQTITAISSVVR